MIRVDNLGKMYVIGHDRRAGGLYTYGSLRDSLAHQARGLWQRVRHPLAPNRETTALEEFWALRNTSFEIQPGEVVGVIGRNGAGKSTLLKLLSRITEPTTGRVELNGRVGSLLEVGTGFHPELSGRENIYLNGAVLGMGRREIAAKFDEIVAFAEVEKFLDTPVKRYSSGMYMRLAFSVAAHLEPEILLVDEVLAVGDAEFQKKCLAKMGEVSRQGRTILFVSHNMSAIQRMCGRVLVIERGRVGFAGRTNEGIDHYLRREKAVLHSQTRMEWISGNQKYPFPETVRPRRFAIVDESGTPAGNRLFASRAYRIVIEADLLASDARLILGINLYDAQSQQLIFSSDVHETGLMPFADIPPGPLAVSARLPAELLWNRSYEIEMYCCFHYAGWVMPPGNDSRLKFQMFRDNDLNPYSNDTRLGLVAPALSWRLGSGTGTPGTEE